MGEATRGADSKRGSLSRRDLLKRTAGATAIAAVAPAVLAACAPTSTGAVQTAPAVAEKPVKGGQIVEQKVGAIGKPEFQKMLDKHI